MRRPFEKGVYISVGGIEGSQTLERRDRLPRPACIERALARAVPLSDELRAGLAAGVAEFVRHAHRRAAVWAWFRQRCAALRAEAVAAFVIVRALRADPAEYEQRTLARQHPGARLAVRADEFVWVLRVARKIAAPAVRADKRGCMQRGRDGTLFHPCSIRDAGWYAAFTFPSSLSSIIHAMLSDDDDVLI
jgi:hypothetical protein